MQITRDGGNSWTNLSEPLPDFTEGSWIPFIHLSKKNKGEAFVVVNDYRRNDYRPMAYHTTDYGTTWTKIVTAEQVSGHTLSMIQDPVEPGLLFLGTDFGLYISVDYGKNWTKWKHFPSVSTADLAIHPREHDLIIGTFGRAAWIMDDIRPLRAIAASKGSILDNDLVIFDTPDAYLASYKSYTGVRFTADGVFQGENRNRGAMMTVWRKPSQLEKDQKKPKNKAKVVIMSMAGDTVRNYTATLDTGMNRLYWPMNRNGVSYPSRRSVRPNADPPSGGSVMPGTYKIIVSWNNQQDSTLVDVKADPRLSITMADMEAQDAANRELEKIVEKATAGFDRLKEARKTVDRVNKAMELAPDSLKKDMGKLGKNMLDSIAQLEELYMQKEGLKGVQRNSDNIMGQLRQARRYISSSMGMPNQAAQRAMKNLTHRTQKAIDAINLFFENDFSAYEGKVQKTSFSLFPKHEPIRMN